MKRGALTERVLEQRLWGESPFFLLDVGCSGGIESRWRAFRDRLRAIGFDPLVAEIDRLNAANTHPGIRYEAAFVVCPDYDGLFPPEIRNDPIAAQSNQPFPRVSAAAVMRRMTTSYIQEVFNAGAPIVRTDRTVSLDDYVPPDDHARVDFIKIDTDGHDIEVLLGAKAILSAGGVIGLSVEMQFHGSTHEAANTFSNIDRLLRKNGFTLFDLVTHRYSRAELPAPFSIDLPAQTTSGQVLWGEAIYFRDLGARNYERMWPYEITQERVMKLACLFDLFELPDCAAELLVNRGGFLAPSVRDGLLDLLASGAPGSYAAHMAAFEKDHTLFYPTRIESAGKAASESPETAAAEAVVQRYDSRVTRELQEKLARLTQKNIALRKKLTIQDDRIAQMTKRVENLKTKRQAAKAGAQAKTGGQT
jgi:FkbM family methyltransferase